MPSIDSMQFLSRFQQRFLEICISKSKRKTPKTYMEMHKSLNVRINAVKEEQSWKHHIS